MTINDGNPLDLEGNDGEEILVEVKTTKAESGMTLDGEVFEGSSFTLSGAKADPSLLTVSGVFVDDTDGGGSFTVRLTGASGPPAVHHVDQFKTQARRAITFTIDVVLT